MARSTNRKISRQHLILCEGIDAEGFMIYFLNNTESEYSEFLREHIQVMDFGGNENLFNYIETIKKMEGFDSVKSILVIRDAETNYIKAQNDIKAALAKAKLPVPEHTYEWADGNIKTAYLLFPIYSQEPVNGTLEDLCLSVLSEENSSSVLDKINTFVSDLKSGMKREFPHEFKTKLHTYFSITDKYVSLKIGEAAKAGAFDWNSSKLNSLRAFIESMREHI